MVFSISKLFGTRGKSGAARVPTGSDGNHSFLGGECESILTQPWFLRMLHLERRRAERSHKKLLLMLVDVENFLDGKKNNEKVLARLGAALAASTRETDIAGWYKTGSLIGVLLTEVEQPDIRSVQNQMTERVRSELQGSLGAEKINGILISFHFIPEDVDEENQKQQPRSTTLSDLSAGENSKGFPLFVKRVMDIFGSLILLIVLSPILLLIALALKLSSKGPVIFKQSRVGQGGRRFTFYKFRSMYVGNNPSIHREYVGRFIGGKAKTNGDDAGQNGVYKITGDPRITPLGRFLRRTSLDEFPQFWNVLKGEMSLVGPRPPLPYEFASYYAWHKRRVFEVKPGLTGLWQVGGRSKTSFDEMVRLDLRYAKTWSFWLDIWVLLKTPKALLSGEGAF